MLAKAIQLCAAGLGANVLPAPSSYTIVIHTGAGLDRPPTTDAEAIATVRDLVARGAAFDAGPLGIDSRDFSAFGVTPASVFDVCALAHIDDGSGTIPDPGAATVSSVTALVRRAFDARITDTIRPMNANYGARYSWHKFGQAIDFVPAGGVNSITREQLRAVPSAHGVHLLELLGPGDPGHSNHWHIAFARPGQVVERVRPVEGEEDWMVDVARAELPRLPGDRADTPAARAPATAPASIAPPSWDVFAAAQWRSTHGGGS